ARLRRIRNVGTTCRIGYCADQRTSQGKHSEGASTDLARKTECGGTGVSIDKCLSQSPAQRNRRRVDDDVLLQHFVAGLYDSGTSEAGGRQPHQSGSGNLQLERSCYRQVRRQQSNASAAGARGTEGDRG